MLASDLNNPQYVGKQDPDEKLYPHFYRKPVENAFQSELQKRPIFEDVDYVRIVIPGDVQNIHDTPVREDHKKRWPKQWTYYEATQGKENLEVGTPLTQWPILSPAQVEMLRAQRFATVEQIANASDLQIAAIGMAGGCAPTTLREKAMRYLTVAKDLSVADQAAKEVEALKVQQAEKDRQHAEQMANMQAQLQALSALVQPKGKATKAKAEVAQPTEQS